MPLDPVRAREVARALSIAGLAVVAAAGCSLRNLDLGSGKLAPDGGGTNAVGGMDGGPSDAPGVDLVPPPGDAAGRDLIPEDTGESPCVTAAVAVPSAGSPTPPLHLDVVTTADAVAVMSRRGDGLDVRTFAYDGSAIGSFRFQADAQVLPYPGDRFLLVARGTTGDFVATLLDATLRGGIRVFTAGAAATEHMQGAVILGMTPILLTDERFISFGNAAAVPWSTMLGAASASAFKSSRIFGLGAQPDRLLIAWGGQGTLRLSAVSPSGTLVAHAEDASFLDVSRPDTASAIPYDTGLLLFDGNPVRVTQIGPDLSRKVLGQNTQLRTFYRTAPQVAAASVRGRLTAFWLTVFPVADNSQGATTHQLYGCELDLADPATCLSTSPIAETMLPGTGIAAQPVAAAALPDGSAVAIAHTDAQGTTWLRIANLACAVPRADP